MPRKEREPAPPTKKWDTILAQLHQGKTYPDPVRAEWDTGEYEGRCYALRNFRLGRYEWAYGRIPADRLGDYEPQKGEGHGCREPGGTGRSDQR